MKSNSQALAFAVLLLTLSAAGSASAQRVRGDITESEYDKKLRSAQESAFSPWMPAQDAFEMFRRSKLDAKLVLAAEKNSKGDIRLLQFFPPDGKGGDVVYENAIPEETLLERHAMWQKQDYNILYVRKNPLGNYTAIWIYSARFGVAVKRLEELGISTAVIRIKATETADASRAKVPVTAPLREWRDKAGRLMQASVAGIEGGTVNFVRADGKKFSYPLDDLSEADQKRLAELQDKSTKGSTAGSPVAEEEGLTNWMSRSDFETRVVEERGKGKFGVYAESNNRNEFRGIFDKLPPGVRWFQSWAEPEQSLREKHSSYVAQGFALLSLSHDRRADRYCGVWVSGMPPGDMKVQLGKFGITTPSIGEKIAVSTVAKR